MKKLFSEVIQSEELEHFYIRFNITGSFLVAANGELPVLESIGYNLTTI